MGATTKTESVPLSITAHRLGVSWERAWRLVLSGALRGQKIQGRWMVEISSLDAYMERNPKPY